MRELRVRVRPSSIRRMLGLLSIVAAAGFAISGTVAGDAAATKSAEEAPKVKRLEIVDRAIEYHGGDLYTNSETELELCSKSGCFQVRARVDGDLYEYDVTGKMRDRERRVLSTNEAVTVWDNGQPVPVEDDPRIGVRDWAMARVYFCFLPYRLNDPSVYKQDLGIVEWQGRRLHKVKVSFEPGSSTDAEDEYLYWFDPDTGRVEQFAYSYFNAYSGARGLRFRKALNHREVGGILFFDQENYAAEKTPSVDVITPEYVEESMRLLSTVRMQNIRVQPLG